MKIPCFRCGKGIETPNELNADYVMAEDVMSIEPIEVFVALKHNHTTRAKVVKIVKANTVTLDTGEKILPTEDAVRSEFIDSEYDAVEIPNLEASRLLGDDLVKVIIEMKEQTVQKTAIICPRCYKATDIVIWGVHKEDHE